MAGVPKPCTGCNLTRMNGANYLTGAKVTAADGARGLYVYCKKCGATGRNEEIERASHAD